MFSAAGPRRFLSARRGYLVHAAVALALVVLAAPRARPDGSSAANQVVLVWWAFSGVMVLGLLVQQHWPLPALVLTCLGAVGHQLGLGPDGPMVAFPSLLDLAVPITLYTLASRARTRRISLAALACVVAAEIAVSLVASAVVQERTPMPEATVAPKPAPDGKSAEATDLASPPESVLNLTAIQDKYVIPGLSVLLALGLAFALGDGNRSRRAHLRMLRQRAADLEREQRQQVALATAAERARIGRELHDVTAHSLSVIVAQAQAALAAQARHSERATQAIREVITVGRDSLAEMRRLVGAFEPGHNLTPLPGIDALPALVERLRAAGTPVQLRVDGTPAGLPTAINLSAYRIVQEALTNTLKHAGEGASATVRLTVLSEYVEVEVTDDGAGPTAAATGEGNGLRGIAERVHLLGGTLAAGPGPDTGFRVRARLPVQRIGAPT